MVHQTKGGGQLIPAFGPGVQTTGLSTTKLGKTAILPSPEDHELNPSKGAVRLTRIRT